MQTPKACKHLHGLLDLLSPHPSKQSKIDSFFIPVSIVGNDGPSLDGPPALAPNQPTTAPSDKAFTYRNPDHLDKLEAEKVSYEAEKMAETVLLCSRMVRHIFNN